MITIVAEETSCFLLFSFTRTQYASNDKINEANNKKDQHGSLCLLHLRQLFIIYFLFDL